MSPILIIGNSSKYKSIFTALCDLGIKMERVTSGEEALAAMTMMPYAAVVMEWDLQLRLATKMGG